MNWLPMGLSYAMFYCTRYNVAAGNVASVQQELDLPSSAFAGVITCGFNSSVYDLAHAKVGLCPP